jgi:hypothetical protein
MKYIGKLSTDVFGVVLDEKRVAKVSWSAAQAAAAGAVRAKFAGSTTVATTKTDAITNPPCPRNIVITPGDTTGDVKAGNVVVVGTNMNDEPISESFAFLDNATGAVVGVKAFKTVTSITIPVQDGTGATFATTFGDKLGLPFKLSENGLLHAVFNNVYEATRPAVAIDDDELEKNTIDLHSALDGSVVVAYFAL